MKRSIAVVAMLVVGFAATTCAQTGREIAQKVKDRPDGDTRRSEMVMTLINKRGAVRERKLISYSIDVGKEKKDRKSIMFFQYPGDVKGTGFLTWDYDELNKDDDKWLYLPAIKKTRRISGSSAKQDYFMGSDFTYDDMGSRNVDEDTHTLLGEETVDGQKCWKLESLPKDKRDIYSRKTALIRQDLSDTCQGGILRQDGQAAPSSRDVGYCQGRGLLGSPEDAHDQRANRASDGSRNQESDVQHSHGGEQV